MTCATCSSDNPEVASYCRRCGTSLRATSSASRTYAVSSAEGVTQLALISTIMPHTNRQSADGFRWAMLLAAALVLGATGLGLLPVAVAGAALLVPLAYVVYLREAELWEDAPLRMLLGLFLVTGVLAAVVSLVFFDVVLAGSFETFVGARQRGGLGSVSVPALLVFVVLLPLVAEVVKNLTAVLLARLPQFDDMIDGLTLGIAAGTTYAAVETLVVYHAVFTTGDLRTTQGLAGWIVVVVNLMIVKSLVYGTATGLAVAAFSGRGEGYDGFTGRYVGAFALAAGANVLYWLGVRLAAYLPFGQALGLLCGVVVLAVLMLLIRTTLQAALLEAAVEDAARSEASGRDTTVEAWCPECENMLLPGSQFCVVCGTSTRSTSHRARRAMRGVS